MEEKILERNLGRRYLFDLVEMTRGAALSVIYIGKNSAPN